jgi:hypothetical protein
LYEKSLHCGATGIALTATQTAFHIPRQHQSGGPDEIPRGPGPLKTVTRGGHGGEIVCRRRAISTWKSTSFVHALPALT